MRDPLAEEPFAGDLPVGLPGEELVSAGLADLAAGRESESSLLVAMAAPRLRALGIEVSAGGGERPSHRLYELLSERGGGGPQPLQRAGGADGELRAGGGACVLPLTIRASVPWLGSSDAWLAARCGSI
ncbi:MAG TPA: hypothetical protein VGX16_04445 [Solirubrobacteraceae bacterium]|nr:hypothetical protein [Solirubrobacteraceae bacterium]